MQLWIDLETTGLDPMIDEIIEVGWFVSDNWEMLTQPQSALVTITKDGWELLKEQPVNQMHTNNGLLKDLVENDTLLIEDVEDQILDELRPLQATLLEPVVLSGSSVHFDRGFIANYMPRLDKELSHRHFDVSTLRMFFDDLGYPELGYRDHDSAHRAQADIIESYRLARNYVGWVNKHAEC